MLPAPVPLPHSASSSHLQSLLQQLHSHVSEGAQAFPPASTSVAAVLPGEWSCASELIRSLRVSLTSMYAPVLTESEKERARVWGWQEEEQRLVTDRAAAGATPPAEAAAVPAFHRFSVPLVPLARDFRTAAHSLGQIVSYHQALVSSVQAAAAQIKLQSNAQPHQMQPVNAQHHHLQPVARSYLLYLKQRLELQRQQSRLSKAFRTVHARVQQEMQDRKRRAYLTDEQRPVMGADGHYLLPACDLYALSSSLAYIRSDLHLSNGAEDPTKLSSVQPAGTYAISNQHTIDQRELPSVSLLDSASPSSASTSLVSDASLAFEKHTINISSTGVSTCFVLDLNLVRPIVRTEADRDAIDRLVTGALALPGGLDGLHPLSSLGQLLRHGFCIYGILNTLSGDDLVEQPLDDELIRFMYASEFRGVRGKIQLLIDHEQMCEANSEERLYLRREPVMTAFQQVVARSVATSAQETRWFVGDRARLEAKLEGPCLMFAAACVPAHLLPKHDDASTPSKKQRRRGALFQADEIGITFVGVERVDRPDASAMDVTGGGVASGSSFAFRFLLSHALTLPFCLARQSFAELYAGVSLPFVPLTSTPESEEAAAAAAAAPIRDGSYHQVAMGQTAAQLLDDEGGLKTHVQRVFGSKQGYTAASSKLSDGSVLTSSSVVLPAVLFSSFLVRNLAVMPNLLHVIRQAALFQRVYRSCFEPAIVPTDEERSAAPAAVSPAPAAAAVAPPAKLKFSYRELLEDQPPLPSHPLTNTSAPVPSGDSYVAVEVSAEPPVLLLLRTAHPITQAEMRIELRCDGPAERPMTATIACEQGYVPSSALATKVINSTGSVPLLLHAIMKRCTAGKRQ